MNNIKNEKGKIRTDVKKEMNLLIQQERSKINKNDINDMKNEFINFLENTNQGKEGYSLSILITHFLHNYLNELQKENVSFSEEMLIETFKNINLHCMEIYNAKYEEQAN